MHLHTLYINVANANNLHVVEMEYVQKESWQKELLISLWRYFNSYGTVNIHQSYISRNSIRIICLFPGFIPIFFFTISNYIMTNACKNIHLCFF